MGSPRVHRGFTAGRRGEFSTLAHGPDVEPSRGPGVVVLLWRVRGGGLAVDVS